MKPKTKKTNPVKVDDNEIPALRATIMELKTTIENQDKIITEMADAKIKGEEINAERLTELQAQNLALQKTISKLEETGKKHWWG